MPDYEIQEPETIERLVAFVELGEMCRWVPTFQNPPTGGPACEDGDGGIDAGVPDLGPQDAGDVGADAGDGPADADGGPDADPADVEPDAGGGGRLCPCPLPDVGLSHCAM